MSASLRLSKPVLLIFFTYSSLQYLSVSAAENSKLKSSAQAVTSSEECWLQEKYEVVEKCRPCKQFELTSNSIPVCSVTGYVEKVSCKSSGEVYRSCHNMRAEERAFWTFEGVWFGVFVAGYIAVFLRQRILDGAATAKVHKQIANSV
ncbi:protein JTB-like [Branchiostoma floridae x Branchiostoma belcheri]